MMNPKTRSVGVVVFVALVLLAGFAALRYGLINYGIVMFMLFPVAIGFVLGVQAVRFTRLFWYTMLGILIFCGLLLALGLEGMICVLMALPLLLAAVGFGYFLGWLITRQDDSRDDVLDDPPSLRLSLLPLILLLVAGPIERALTPKPVLLTIKTSIELPYSAAQVYEAVLSMDTLDADKPILMKLGLPAPYKCVLDREAIGARRTCYFPNGKIVSQMTALDKPYGFSMKVTDYTLMGLRWFRFEDASYVFEASGDKTRITRLTSYRSNLNPRWYWGFFERWGIEQEHQYVLASLRKNLAAANPQNPLTPSQK